jgi:hypothetical protein
MVPPERDIVVRLLQADKNSKEAKKGMKEAEKLVMTSMRGGGYGDYKGAAAAYGTIYDKYKNFEAGYNQAVLTEATEGAATAIGLMETVIANEADEAKKSMAQATLAQMQQRNSATQAAQQQLSR